MKKVRTDYAINDRKPKLSNANRRAPKLPYMEYLTQHPDTCYARHYRRLELAVAFDPEIPM